MPLYYMGAPSSPNKKCEQFQNTLLNRFNHIHRFLPSYKVNRKVPRSFIRSYNPKKNKKLRDTSIFLRLNYKSSTWLTPTLQLHPESRAPETEFLQPKSPNEYLLIHSLFALNFKHKSQPIYLVFNVVMGDSEN